MSGQAQPPAPAAARRKMLGTFEGQAPSPPPIWLMRQAGRYLPEYREVRQRAGSFLDLCYNPELAAEVTLQPIRRYGLDAAILFSDILVVPHALGQGLRFVEGEGPRLDPVRSVADLGRPSPSGISDRLAPVYETVSRVRAALPAETTLIGFCGAPWTVATYMVAGRGTPDQADARLWAYRDPAGFQMLIDRLVETSVAYLCGQVRAGADVLQLFDTWAGNLPAEPFRRWVEAPTRTIVDGVRKVFPTVPIIGFARGAGTRLGSYVAATGVDGAGVDTSLPMRDAIAQVGPRTVVQGNLDPLLLVAGGAQMDVNVRDILAAARGRPFVFNLGHGIVPETPPEHVARLVQVIRGGGA